MLVASVVPGSTGLVADPTQRSEQVVVVGPPPPPIIPKWLYTKTYLDRQAGRQTDRQTDR